MKFAVSTSELQRTLAKLAGVLPTRSTMPILENILFDLRAGRLTMTGTDLSVSLTVSTEVQGVEDGRIAVPAKRLVDTVRSLSDVQASFTIDTTSSRITLTTPNGHDHLTGENAKEYPQIPAFQGTGSVSIENDTLRSMIHRTVFAVSTDELRPAMMGVLFQAKGKELRAVSTDGHRLVRLIYTGLGSVPITKDIIVPAKALSILEIPGGRCNGTQRG